MGQNKRYIQRKQSNCYLSFPPLKNRAGTPFSFQKLKLVRFLYRIDDVYLIL